MSSLIQNNNDIQVQVKNVTPNINSVKKNDTKPKNTISKTEIGLVSLAGLTALASVGYYLVTRGKGKPNVKSQNLGQDVNISNKLKDLQEHAKELKQKIVTKYFQRLDEESGSFVSLRTPSNKNAYKVIENDQKDMQKLLSDNEPVVTQFTAKVKNSLKALQNDSDFSELNRLRHQFKREIYNNNHTENAGKLELINEIIYTKLNGGQKTPYFEKLELSIEDAINLIKNDSLSAKDFHTAIYKNVKKEDFKSLIYLDKAGTSGSWLTLNSIFQDGNNAEYAYKNVKRAKKYLTANVAETTKQKIRNVRVNVAQEIRQSEDVKTLKELNKQITELKKS